MEIKVIETKWSDFDRAVISVNPDFDAVVEIEYPKCIDKNIGVIWNLFVVPEKRRKGIGKKLLDAAFEHIKNHGCGYAEIVWDGRDSPEWVYDWYLRNGFMKKRYELGIIIVRLRKRL